MVASVDYRLGPEERYPKAVDDAEEALYWIRDHGKAELNVNLDQFAVGGSSRFVPSSCTARETYCHVVAATSLLSSHTKLRS